MCRYLLLMLLFISDSSLLQCLHRLLLPPFPLSISLILRIPRHHHWFLPLHTPIFLYTGYRLLRPLNLLHLLNLRTLANHDLIILINPQLIQHLHHIVRLAFPLFIPQAHLHGFLGLREVAVGAFCEVLLFRLLA